MPASLWTACDGPRSVKPLSFDPWRVVESQHAISTRKLVDSLDEQALIEEILDGAKPRPVPPDLAHLHYLLYTPFRYPPLPNGSRFGTRRERGIWYGALEVRTALAEAAYYRLLFLEGTKADLAPLLQPVTAFRAAVRAARAVDLMRAPFLAHRGRISSPTSYRTSQALGADMRAGNVQAILFASARDRERGRNAALFAPAFRKRAPTRSEPWHSVAEPGRVEFRHAVARDAMSFSRAEFLVAGRLPVPGLGR